MGKLLQQAESCFFYTLLLLLPTQLGKHFWPDFSIISGIRIDYLSPTLYVTDIVVFILFVCWAIRSIQNSKLKTQKHKLEFSMFNLTFPYLLLSILLSQNIWNGGYHLLKFLEYFFLAYYVVSIIHTTKQVKRIFFFLGISVIGESLLTIAQVLHQASLGGIFYFFGERTFSGTTPGIANASINGELILRPYGTFSHPNVLAGFLLCVMIALLFSLSWMKTNWEKLVWTTALLLGSSALLLTLSRVANALWILLLTVVFLLQIRARRILLVVGILLIIVLGITVFSTPFGGRIIQTSLTEEAVVQRTELIRSSVQLFMSHALFGVGFGNFLPALAQVQKPLSLGLYLQPVHNIFLLVLVETGLVGIGLSIWFLTITYKRLFMMVRKTGFLSYRILVILLSLVLITGVNDHYWLTLQQGQLLFSLLLGLSWVRLRT